MDGHSLLFGEHRSDEIVATGQAVGMRRKKSLSLNGHLPLLMVQYTERKTDSYSGSIRPKSALGKCSEPLDPILAT